MKAQREIASFVLRFTHELWQDVDGEPRVEWRGQVRRVQDGKEFCFRELAEALAFMQDSLLKVTKRCLPKADKDYQERALNESCKYWEKIATNYETPELEVFYQPATHQENTQKYISEIDTPHQLPSASTSAQSPPFLPHPHVATNGAIPDQMQLLQTCSALQSQVEALSRKVQILEQALAEQQISAH